MSNSLMKYINNRNVGHLIDDVQEYTVSSIPSPGSLHPGSVISVNGFTLISTGTDFSCIARPCTLNAMINLVGFAGARCRLTDYPSAPDFYWNTTYNRWALTTPWAFIEDSTLKTRVSANNATDATDALIHTIALPNILGPNSRVNIRYYYTSGPGTTTAKTIYAKWPGSYLPINSIAIGGTGRVSEVTIYNDNSLISQKCANTDTPTGSLSNSMMTYSADTANPLNITFFSKFSASVLNESISIQHISIVIYP